MKKEGVIEQFRAIARSKAEGMIYISCLNEINLQKNLLSVRCAKTDCRERQTLYNYPTLCHNKVKLAVLFDVLRLVLAGASNKMITPFTELNKKLYGR